MKLIICEDNEKILTYICDLIKKYALINEWDIDIVLKTQYPEEVLNYISNNDADCYLLDVDLGENHIDGITLGKKIKELYPIANLIFITTLEELKIKVLDEMLSPIAYITKESSRADSSIRQALSVAYTHFLEKTKKIENNTLALKIGNRTLFFDINDILYFETLPEHRIQLSTTDNTLEFYGKLSEIEPLHISLFNCHRSFLVNIKTINNIEKNTVIFKNSDTLFLPDLAIRRIKKELNVKK